jgi:hypothetical protein
MAGYRIPPTTVAYKTLDAAEAAIPMTIAYSQAVKYPVPPRTLASIVPNSKKAPKLPRIAKCVTAALKNTETAIA